MADRPVVEFDHHDQDFHRNRHAEWAELRSCPVAFNPRYGGFWVVSGYDEVATVSRDGDTFSSKHSRAPEDGIDYLGIAGIPRAKSIPTAGIAEVEGPVHTALRRVMNPFLVPNAVARMEPLMEQVTTWFVDQHIEQGEMDLVLDLANPVPAILTMHLVGPPPRRLGALRGALPRHDRPPPGRPRVRPGGGEHPRHARRAGRRGGVAPGRPA